MFALLTFLVVLGLLVFVHELGHFLAARRSGMAVDEFGFGFPPRLIGIQRVHGQWRVLHGNATGSPASTVYSINWLPLGGFVKIRGENGGDASDAESFVGQPRWRRAIVLVAGVAMNTLLAIVLFTTVFAIGARQLTDDLPPGARISNIETTIVGVLAGSPAAEKNFAAGDVIRAVDGVPITERTPLQEYIRSHADGELSVTIERDGNAQTIAVRAAPLPGSDQRGIGVQLVETGFVRFPFGTAVIEGVRMTGYVMVEILRAVGGVFRGIFTSAPVPTDVAGPVGIAVLTGQVAALGIVHLLQFTAVLSANLALLNVLPFPALDGGRLFLLAIESVRRRALAKRVENAIHATGFAVLLVIIVLVTYRDLQQFGGGIVDAIRGVFG